MDDIARSPLFELLQRKAAVRENPVVDAFYVRESGGSKVTDDSRLSEITQKIAAELGL